MELNARESERTMPTSPSANPFDPPLFAEKTCAPFSIEALLDRFRGKSTIVEQVLGEFEEQAVRDLQSLADSLKANDAEGTASVAHGLKGAAGLLSAQALHRLAGDLEQMGRRAELDGAEACVAQVKKEVDGCLAYILAVRTQMSEAKLKPTKNPMDGGTACIS